MVHVNDISVQPKRGRAGSENERCVLAPTQEGTQRMRVGAISVEVRRSTRRFSTHITVGRNDAVLAVALRGCSETENDAVGNLIDTETAVLLAKPGRSRLVWSPASEGVILRISRQRLQGLSSRRIGLPTRLAAVDRALPLSVNERLAPLLRELIDECDRDAALSDDRQRLWCGRLEATITTLLVNMPVRETVLAVSRSVRRAMQHVCDNAEVELDVATLASISGVTVRTLREGFRSCLGVSLTAFIQETRLAKARERLLSGHDSRSMARVAEAAGFCSASSFSRAYSRTFEESPTDTRARGVREGEVRRKLD